MSGSPGKGLCKPQKGAKSTGKGKPTSREGLSPWQAAGSGVTPCSAMWRADPSVKGACLFGGDATAVECLPSSSTHWPCLLPTVAAIYDVTLNFRGNKNPSLLGILYGKKYEADMCVR